jgi:hypothetical protein
LILLWIDYSGGVGLAHVFDFAGNEWTQFRQVDGVTNWDASVAGSTKQIPNCSNDQYY